MNLSPSLIWFIVGVVFLISEMLAPGFVLIFFTAGSWIVGLSILLFKFNMTTQLIVFIVSSLILLFSLRKYAVKIFRGDITEQLDGAYAESTIGKSAIVTKAIKPGIPGQIKMMGSFWRAVSDNEINEGRSVVIERKDSDEGLTFKVKPL